MSIFYDLYRYGRKTIKYSINSVANKFDYPVVVLTYHRVIDINADVNQLCVSPENFRDQIRYLKNHYPILRFEEDWNSITGPSVVITFDDGYYDNYIESLPILEEFSVPATFFVSTANIGTQELFWWDILEYIVLGTNEIPEYFELKDGSFGKQWPTISCEERRLFHDEILQLILRIDTNKRNDWISQVLDWYSSSIPQEWVNLHRSMTVDELRGLANSPFVTIGAHTITHTGLASLSKSDQKKEIELSRIKLESWTKKKVQVFSYPYGDKLSYNKNSIDLCRELGFTKASSTHSGYNYKWSNPFRVKRIGVRNWCLDQFVSSSGLDTFV